MFIVSLNVRLDLVKVNTLSLLSLVPQVEWGILNLAGAKVQHTEANKTAAVSVWSSSSLSLSRPHSVPL